MSTPQLKLHRLSEERPEPSSAYLLTFFKPDDTSLVKFNQVDRADSSYIQTSHDTDYNRFYVSQREVADFLLNHDLLEVPLVDHEVKAYEEAFGKWLESPARKCVNPTYRMVRQTFIQALVEDRGFTFDQDKYQRHC